MDKVECLNENNVVIACSKWEDWLLFYIKNRETLTQLVYTDFHIVEPVQVSPLSEA